MPELQNFIKKEILAQLFSSEFSKVSKNNFFTEHLRTTASVRIEIYLHVVPIMTNFTKGLNYSE